MGNQRWQYTTRTFRALGYRFALRTTEPRIGRVFDDLYRASAVRDAGPEAWYSVAGSSDPGEVLSLWVDESWIADFDRPSRLLQYLAWHMNREVIARSHAWVLIHAAAAARDGVAVLLPARPEAGKTTLVAGLLRSGFDYFTDEAAGIDPETLLLHPYPKPLSIDPGSWSVLPELNPAAHGGQQDFFEQQWQVSAETIPSCSVAAPTVPTVLVFPAYRAGAPTEIQAVSRSDALLELLRNTFSLRESALRDFSVLADLTREGTCYRLTSGSLQEACNAVSLLVDRELAARRTGVER